MFAYYLPRQRSVAGLYEREFVSSIWYNQYCNVLGNMHSALNCIDYCVDNIKTLNWDTVIAFLPFRAGLGAIYFELCHSHVNVFRAVGLFVGPLTRVD